MFAAAAFVIVVTAAQPRVTNCLPPCACGETTMMAKTRLAETPHDGRRAHIVFDDHPALVAIELELPDDNRPGKATVTVTDWDGKPVNARQVSDGWKQPSPRRWLQLVKLQLSPGAYHAVSRVRLPCGEVAMWVPTFEVYPRDPTSLYYWQLQVGIARQEGTMDDELRAWRKLEQVDGHDHALDRANTLEAAGRKDEAERERQGYRTRNPSGRTFPDVTWPPFAHGVKGTPFNLVDGSRCYDLGYSEVYVMLGSHSGARPKQPVAGDRVALAVHFTTQATSGGEPPVTLSLSRDGGQQETPVQVVWRSSPMTDPTLRFPTRPAKLMLGTVLFGAQPGSWTAEVQVRLECGTQTHRVAFEAVPADPSSPEYWAQRSAIALDALLFDEVLDDLDRGMKAGGADVPHLRVQALRGLGRREEAEALQRRLTP